MTLPVTRLPAALASIGAGVLASSMLLPAHSSAQTRPVLPPAPVVIDSTDPVALMVGRLDLEKYKATIKGLAQFGDRREGTARNRAAIDWIEAQLKSYGCTNTERITYEFAPRARPAAAAPAAPAAPRPPAAASTRTGPQMASGGGRARGVRTRTGVNNDSLAQTDPRLRALNSEPSTPGQRQEVYCTKVGTTRPDEMYIIGAHMDGIGWGEAVNDDASGTALVMELARIFHEPDVTTERSVRFIENPNPMIRQVRVDDDR